MGPGFRQDDSSENAAHKKTSPRKAEMFFHFAHDPEKSASAFRKDHAPA